MISQREITAETPLPPPVGAFTRWGYARRMVFGYNRRLIRRRPFGLKEWDFYQIHSGDWVLQLTIGHVSYMGSFSATLFNLKTGLRTGVVHLRPFPLRSVPMEENPETPHVLEAGRRDWKLKFETTAEKRFLSMGGRDRKAGNIDIKLTLANDPLNEKMVIATPFKKPGQFYLNYKENYWTVAGHAGIGETMVEFGPEAVALLDWGRGVWPFRHEWFWGNGTGTVQGGRFGFNIGWGFGDTSGATENMFFWQGKAHKLGTIRLERDEADYRRPWRFTDDSNCFDFVMKPVYDNYTETKLLFVNNRCHQVFGDFSGKAVLPDGEVIQAENFRAFCEHAENQW
ncbi:MAG: DUF2804 domain-containing protein [Treponema sp.]|jgi:hypothetical protein|nr:DUF2804 domain-containing protein [Treponema sp.]